MGSSVTSGFISTRRSKRGIGLPGNSHFLREAIYKAFQNLGPWGSVCVDVKGSHDISLGGAFFIIGEIRPRIGISHDRYFDRFYNVIRGAEIKVGILQGRYFFPILGGDKMIYVGRDFYDFGI